MTNPTPTEVERLSEQLANAYEEISLVQRLGERMSLDRDAGDYLTEACAEAAATMEAVGVGCVVWDKAMSAQICCPGTRPVWTGPDAFGIDVLCRVSNELRDRFDAGEEFVLSNEVPGDPRFAAVAAAGGRQVLAVPMRRRGATLGCLFAVDKDVPPEVFGRHNDGVFTSIDRKLLAGVATHAGLFLENRRLFDDAESVMMGLLHSMVAAVDAKDAYTRGHSVRVALFARRLAEADGHAPDFCGRVYLAGLLHDVGKIGVDDAVLRKPGKLDADEFAQIQRHPEIGHRILEKVPGITDVLPGVLYHHEKVDGRGYPHRLVGEEIPLLGRVMCIADSFDAMTSSRTYRPAMPIADALAEVARCAGTQFDAGLAELFCAIPPADFVGLIRREQQGDLPAITPVGSENPTLRAAA